MTRAPSVPAALPKIPSRISLWPWPPDVARTKLERLKMLNAAASNFRPTFSVTLKFLAKVMSVSHEPGPTNVLRPRLPRQPRHGGVKVGTPENFDPVAGLVFQPLAHSALVGWKLANEEFGRSFRPRVSR